MSTKWVYTDVWGSFMLQICFSYNYFFPCYTFHVLAEGYLFLCECRVQRRLILITDTLSVNKWVTHVFNPDCGEDLIIFLNERGE